MGCPMVPAWGLLVGAAETAALVAGLPGWGLGALHLALAGLTPGVWQGLGRAPLAARRAGWLTLGAPFVGAFAAACLPAAARAGGDLVAPEPDGVPLLGPLETAPPPPAHRGAWELEALLREGSLEGKLDAVRGLKGLPAGEGVPMLRAALVAGDQQAALLASLALAELEEGLEAAIRYVRPIADTPHGALALAGVLRRYAESGLPAPTAAAAAWREAGELLERVTAAGEAGADAWGDLAAARLATGRPDLALAAAEAALAARPGDAGAALVRLKALFALGEAGRLRAAARELRAIAPPGSAAHDVASYWAGDMGRAA